MCIKIVVKNVEVFIISKKGLCHCDTNLFIYVYVLFFYVSEYMHNELKNLFIFP